MTRWIAAAMALFALTVLSPRPVMAVATAADATQVQDVRDVPRISIDDVKTLMAKKQVLLIDVRDPMAFGEGHIPGAMNVPFDFLPDHAEAWKKDKRLLVTYCACVNEGTAARAALDMNAFGVRNVKALLGGYNEWMKRGEKIVKGSPTRP
jgi:rhodanese-related sulfurtransferase